MLNRVLLIDDSEPDLLFSRIVLERSGIVREVVGFESAREALAWLRAPGSPAADLILLDINMPGMDGFDFLAAYESELANQPRASVVMLSSSSDPDDRRRSRHFSSVCGFITKPLAGDDARRLPDLLPA